MIIVKPIKGYEHLYIIDNLGNVVSLPKMQGNKFVNKYKILTNKINGKTGYIEVSLSKNGKLKTFLLHKLLAEHFILNPNNYPCVNHKNGIKTDNRLNNLEWCSYSYNTKHAYINNLGGFKERVDKQLLQLNNNKTYNFIKLIDSNNIEYDFKNTKEASIFIGCKVDNITSAIRKNRK